MKKRFYLDTYSIVIPDTGDKIPFPNKEAAMKAASAMVGNHAHAKPFPNQETFFYGPGDGTTTLFVNQDSELREVEDDNSN